MTSYTTTRDLTAAIDDSHDTARHRIVFAINKQTGWRCWFSEAEGAAGRPVTPTAVEQVTENLGGSLVGRFEEVGVNVERRGSVRVAEPPGNGLDRDAGREESGGSEVARSCSRTAEMSRSRQRRRNASVTGSAATVCRHPGNPKTERFGGSLTAHSCARSAHRSR